MISKCFWERFYKGQYGVCKGKVTVQSDSNLYFVRCAVCGYEGPLHESELEAIEEHNRVAGYCLYTKHKLEK